MSDGQGYSQQQMFEMLMESQYWSREQMQEYQRSQLEQMLRHAKANVPFYKTRLDCMFRRDGSINWDRWEEIPILTKQDVRDHGMELCALDMPQSHGEVRAHSTSGITSVPLTVLHTELEEEFWIAFGWRARASWDVDWDANAMQWPQQDADDAAGPALKHLGRWGPAWGNPPAMGELYSIARSASLDKRAGLLRSTNSRYLLTRSSVAFAAALESPTILDFPPIERVFSDGVTVEEEHEVECLEKFGARIHSSYSSKEAGRIGYSCRSNQCYHLMEEAVLCEVVNEAGRSMTEGETGNIVVTPFMCAAMPLIRYAQGDRARQLSACECGRTLQTLSAIEGRTHFLFVLPTGKKFAPSVPDYIRIASGVSGWQIAQVGASDIEIRYVSSTDLTGVQLRDSHEAISALMQNAFDIHFRRLQVLPETPSGKFIKYVNEYSTKR